MTGSTIQILFAMIIYMAAVIVIGIVFAGRANKSSENYFLGGRSLGPWVTAMSAEASDMSGWLLMGLPGVAYWCGLADAAWTAIGLAFGTYLNWLIVSKRLRRYSIRTVRSHFRSSSPTVSARRRRPCLQSRRSSSSFSSRSTRRAALSPAESCSLHCSGCLMSR